MARIRYLFIVGFLFASVVLQATHIRSVEVVARRIDCFANTYEITFTAYLSTNNVPFGGGEIDFGDGERIIMPEVESVLIDSYNGVRRARFTIIHTYPGPGTYIASYKEQNRNESILNMDESVNTAFYVEAEIIIQPGVCNSSPNFLVPPVDRTCSGKAYYHHPGTRDPDGDSLSYELVRPRQDRQKDVFNYRMPDLPEFYQSAGLSYNESNEAGTGPPEIWIDPVTGLLTWDAPGSAGEYAIALKITEWRFRISDSTWFEIGYTLRDMQIIVESCDNGRPTANLVEEICVMAGTPVEFSLTANDPDGDLVLIQAFSELFALENDAATIDPAEAIPQATIPPHDTASMHFRWQTTCEHVQQQPHQVVFRISDRPASGAPMVQFRTVRIKVLAESPEYKAVTVNPVSKEVRLEWKGYDCDEVTGFQIWRRVSRYEYDAPECSSGMQPFLRYTLVGEVAPDLNDFTDDDVAIGALYCYRLVALIGPSRAPSRISIDTCLIPRPAEAPVITNVSVRSTNTISGEILVRWTSPFDIDPVQYPPPYQYRVYRSAGDGGFVAASGVIQDTTFVDEKLNTAGVSYRYLIQLFVPSLSPDPVDTSSVSSSVFLAPLALPNGVRITWDAKTPWYNYLQHHPYHLVYRSVTGAEDDFVLIDSVDVNENGFLYEDLGQFQDQPLEQGVSYYYKVMTRGGYGNPRIPEPLENVSQISAGVLLDVTPPCAPIVMSFEQGCDALPCPPTSFSNQLFFSFNEQSCDEPDLTFEIYSAAGPDETFELTGTTREMSFTHQGLESKALCYRVAAVDPAGNRSEFSQDICFDNCPSFSLPNVITPGNRDDRNDVLMAFNGHNSETECARFVKQVDIRIFNRWGQEIHFANGITPEDNLVFWDGYSPDGSRIGPGVYYYEANVLFDVRDPQLRRQRVKGWIHVLSD